MELLRASTERLAALNGGDVEQAKVGALKLLWSLTIREAQTLTYADAFFLIMICFVIATIMVPLMRKVAPARRPPADAH